MRHRVVRVANWGALAPFEALGLDEYQRFQSQETREYFAAVRKSAASCTALFTRLDSRDRVDLAPNDPRREVMLEPNRQGVGGWVDDERSLQAPWGFDVKTVRVPTLIHANPQDTLTPPNFAVWLAKRIDSAKLVISTNALGHVAVNDRVRAARTYFSWLLEGGDPIVP
jgi:pimeloyl-ACP methyl ester carboxylesterase